MTETSTTLYTLTSSGDLVVITSVVTTVVGTRPSGGAGAGSGTNKALNGNSAGNNSFFDNTGAVAGTFVVVGLVTAGIALGLAFFFLRRKKRRQLDEDLRVAAGGAGDGGAGVNRFAGEDDDPFAPGAGSGSEGHHSSYHPPTMSSYGTVPLAAAAAGFGAANGAQKRHSAGLGGYDDVNRRSMSGMSANGGSIWDPAHSPSQSAYGGVNNSLMAAGGVGAVGSGAAGRAGADALAGYQAFGPGYYGGAPPATAQSQEGSMYPDWAEYVDEADENPKGSGSAEGSGSGSGEGMMCELYVRWRDLACGPAVTD